MIVTCDRVALDNNYKCGRKFYRIMFLTMCIAKCSTLQNPHFSQKQLPRKVKLRLVIIECAGNIFQQSFIR